MRLRRSGLLLLLFVSSCLIAFLGVSIDALAADPVYKQLTPTEAYAFYGDSIEATYYSQSGYKRVTLYPSSNRYAYYKTGSFVGQNIPDWLNNTNLRYVFYGAIVSDYSQNPSYLGLDISPNVHFSDCTALRFAACGYLGGTHVSSSSYESSFINLYAGGQLRFENSLYTSSDNYYPEITLTRGGGSWSNSLVWADYQSDTVMNVSMVRVGLNGVRLDEGYLGVYLLCPLVNDEAISGTGVITGSTTSASSGDINVNVDVDMSETNSWLENIFDGVSNIFSSITGALSHVFLPDEDYVKNWADDVIDLIKSKFAGTGVNADPLIDAFEDIATYGATTSIRFPGLDVNLGGTNFHINPRSVSLRPMEDSGIYNYIEMAINIVATLAVFNLVQTKIKALLVGESVVEVEGVDD